MDAFVTDKAFSGNPAAVVILEGETDWPDDGWMQGLGMEFNQAETAFALPLGDGSFGLRWKTPTVEVDLCGHATMGATRAMLEAGLVGEGGEVRFQTRSGELICTTGSDVVSMDFPAKNFGSADPPENVVPGALFWGSNGMDWLAEMADESAVRAYEPDFEKIERIGMRGLIITAPATETDYVCRFFAPASGVPEDHVTGSAHCGVGPYWAAKIGKTDLVGFQASPRGGTVRVRVGGDRVRLDGRCRIVAGGRLF